MTRVEKSKSGIGLDNCKFKTYKKRENFIELSPSFDVTREIVKRSNRFDKMSVISEKKKISFEKKIERSK